MLFFLLFFLEFSFFFVYLHCKPITFFVMKKQVFKPLDELTVDVLDYMFVEWLVRRSLYSKFTANLARYYSDSRDVRSIIRDLIRAIPCFPVYEPSNLISSSFPFRCTPEGFRFWSRVSCEWASYLESFSKII